MRSRCRSRNFAELLRRLDEEVGPLAGGVVGELTEHRVAAHVHAIASLAVVLEVRSEPFSEEHRVMPFEDPLAGAVAERAGGLVGLQLVERPVVGQVEQDDVVEVPAVGDVVPAQEADAELLLVLLAPGAGRSSS